MLNKVSVALLLLASITAHADKLLNYPAHPVVVNLSNYTTTKFITLNDIGKKIHLGVGAIATLFPSFSTAEPETKIYKVYYQNTSTMQLTHCLDIQINNFQIPYVYTAATRCPYQAKINLYSAKEEGYVYNVNVDYK